MTSMEESARKGLELLDLDGTADATSRKKCTDDGPLRMIAASGFDTSLPEDENEMRLKKHFSSCGKVWNVSILCAPPKSIALILLREGALDKARELSGSDMDGCKILVDSVFPLKPIGRKRYRPFNPYVFRDAVDKMKKKKEETSISKGVESEDKAPLCSF